MRFVFCLFAFTLVGLQSGCQTGTVSAKVPVSGGGTIIVPMNREGPPAGEGEGYRVAICALQPGKQDREVYYRFGLMCAHEPALRRILIEDISDDAPATLIDDQNPRFTERHWMLESEPLTAEDPRLKFVYQITVSMRVYRFTLTAKDGHVITFNHVAVYPPFLKAAVRAKWGEKY